MPPQDTPTLLLAQIAPPALILIMIAATILLVALILICVYKKRGNKQLSQQDVYYSTADTQTGVYYSTVGPPIAGGSVMATSTEHTVPRPHREGTDQYRDEITTTEVDTKNHGAYYDTDLAMVTYSEIETKENAAYACSKKRDMMTISTNPAYGTNVSIAPEIVTERNRAYMNN